MFESPIGHTYITTTIYSTCTEAGSIVYSCACGDTYDEIISATGHKFNLGESKCLDCDFNKSDTCGCKCHKTGFFAKIIWKITIFFNKIFKKNKDCTCGIYHY